MRWIWAGERSLLLRFSGALPDANARAISLWRALQLRGLKEIEDIVPGARTVLITLHVGAEPSAALIDALADPPTTTTQQSAHHDIVVRYDGEDLDDIARASGMPVADVVALHSGAEYRVGFIGFSPGFPYLIGLPRALHVPRLATPRTRVPAGALAIAGEYAGVYPRATPGGWRLIGTTIGARLFDETARPPALLRPGDAVRFHEDDKARMSVSGGSRVTAYRTDARIVIVESAGPLTTFQDAGRTGHGSSGVPASGAFDASARAVANMLVGNDVTDAVLECTLVGPSLRFECDAVVAIAGARTNATIDGAPFPLLTTVVVRTGQRIDFGKTIDGARAYVAVNGSFAHPSVLDGLTRHVAAELGPPPLRAGDPLALGPASMPAHARAVMPPSRSRIRIVPGAQWDLFDDGARATLTSDEFIITNLADRTGVRIEGPAVRGQVAEIDPEGVPLGAIQVTPDGRAVILGPDRPITGGYPKIATVIESDIRAIAQARPGEAVRFELVTIEDARAAWREHERASRTGIVEG